METQPRGEGDGISEEAIRQRAYEISQRDGGGTPEENWRRAEAELTGGAAQAPDLTGEDGQPHEDLPGVASP